MAKVSVVWRNSQYACILATDTLVAGCRSSLEKYP